MRTALLGLNLWVVALVVPFWVAVPRELSLGGYFLLPLVPLGIGLVLLRRSQSASAWLLGVFPTVLAAVMSQIEHWTLEHPHPAFSLVVVAISLLAYGALTAHGLQRPAWDERATSDSLASARERIGDRSRLWRRRAMLGVGGLGALLIAVVAPFAGGPRVLREAWGESADEASVLVAVVGGALGTLALATFIGPATRRRKRATSERQRRTRVVMLMTVALTGAGVWWLLRQR